MKIQRITFAALTLLLALPQAKAQKPDLSDPRLEGIELEYIGRDIDKQGAYVYRDLTYWHLWASHYQGWNGADGCFSYSLPDGNTLWTFADSFTGVVTEYRKRDRPANLVRNAAFVQTGERSYHDMVPLGEYVSKDANDNDHYYKMKTWLRHPGASLTQQQIDNGDTDSNLLYWESDGTVIKRDGKPIMQLMWGAVNSSMESQGRAIAEYSLEGKPGDEGYMKLLALHENVPESDYGTVMEDDSGYTYVYGNVSSGLGGYPVVARIKDKSRDLLDPWEYYINDGNGNWSWTDEWPSKEVRLQSEISSEWAINFGVFKYGDKYYMCGIGITGGDITIKQADYPWGPFEHQFRLATIPSEHAAAYDAWVHPQLSRTGEIVVSYNMNPVTTTTYSLNSDGTLKEESHDGFARNFNDRGSADLYQSHFLRIFNWQSLYGVENIGPIVDPNIASYNAME